MPIQFPDTSVNNNVSFFLDFDGITRSQETAYDPDLLAFRDKTDNTEVSVADNGAGYLQMTGGDSLYTGENGYLSTTYDSALSLGTGAYTIEIIMLLPSSRTQAAEGILSVGATASSNNWEISIDALNRPIFEFGTASTSGAPTAALATDSLQHIAIVRTGTGANETTVYLNGTSVKTFTDDTDYNYTDGLYIGSGRDGSGFRQGYIKNVRISTEAKYTENFTAPTSLPYVAIGDTYSYLDKVYKWSGVKWFDRSKFNANIPGEYQNYAAYTASSNTTTIDVSSANFVEVGLVSSQDTEIVFDNTANEQSFLMKINQLPEVTTEGWVINSSSYTGANVSLTNPSDTNPRYLRFKPDGSKLFVYGGNTGVMYEFDLSINWDITTATYNGSSFSTLAQDNQVYGMFVKPDGTKMYIVGSQYDLVREYTLSTPWSLSSAALQSSLVVSQTANPQGLFFSTDGTKMYIGSSNSPVSTIFEYNLSTPWITNTASYSGSSLSISSVSDNTSFSFSSDGSRMHAVSAYTDTVYQYDLTTPWSVSTAVYNGINLDISSEDTVPEDIHFKVDGSKMYISGSATSTTYEYNSLGDISVFLGQAVTWPSNISWSTGTAPSITTSTLIEFYKYNGTWHGNVISENL